MKKFIIIILLFAVVSTPTFARGKGSHSGGHSTGHSYSGGSHSIKGYARKDGTYVAPSRATNPNNSRHDNWSTKGNVNPYTGKSGNKDPFTGR